MSQSSSTLGSRHPTREHPGRRHIGPPPFSRRPVTAPGVRTVCYENHVLICPFVFGACGSAEDAIALLVRWLASQFVFSVSIWWTVQHHRVSTANRGWSCRGGRLHKEPRRSAIWTWPAHKRSVSVGPEARLVRSPLAGDCDCAVALRPPRRRSPHAEKTGHATLFDALTARRR